MGDKGGVGKAISLQDWDQIMQDFRFSLELQQKWLAIWPRLALLEQALVTILKKEVILASRLLVFIEENSAVLIGEDVSIGFGMILESLRGVHSTNDVVFTTSSLRENMMVMATAVAIVTDTLHFAREKLEGLVELFLVFINRPNYSPDRHVRGLACDCLRELEMAYPCLLYGCMGHIHYLCRNEKTHANQSYTLLLTTILENLTTLMYRSRSKSANYLPILQNTAPLVPFSVPFFLVSSTPGNEIQSLPARELTPGNLREFRTVAALLLERPQLLTPVGMLELVSSMIKVSKALDLSGSTLKTHFLSLIHSYSPVLCHILLLIYINFMDSLDGDEIYILKRLLALARDDSQLLPFRLLSVHWLLGVETLHARKGKSSIVAPFASGLYPLVFDPLSLKAAKLGALARCAVSLDQQGLVSQGSETDTNETMDPASVLLNDGLISVSSYKWLPPWSTETKVAFHIFHKVLTVAFPHSKSVAHIPVEVCFMKSRLFQTLQKIFVTMAVQMRKLVPNLVVLLDRLLDCDVHRAIGEKLLQTFNEELLPRLEPNRHLPAYFPLLERIAGIKEMPPSALIEKIMAYVVQRVEDDVVDEERVLWSRSTEVLGICRTVLLHNSSSRVFHHVAPLLAFLCQSYPDIEIRDSARLYLRMLISIPGNKLREILRYGDERIEEANAPQVSSLFRPSSFTPSRAGKQQPLLVSSYIQFSRITPLVIRHSWSLVLYDYLQSSGGIPYEVNVKSPQSEIRDDSIKGEAVGIETDLNEEVEPIEVKTSASTPSDRSLRVMDARTSEIIFLLRRHFAEIPDYISGAGLRIKVPCTIKFHGEYRQRLLGEANPGDLPTPSGLFSSVLDSTPAIYGAVITFTTSGFYGAIPEVRVPFLLGEPLEKNWQRSADIQSSSVSDIPDLQGRDIKGQQGLHAEDRSHSLEKWHTDTSIVPWDSGDEEDQMFSELVVVELEPKKPVPTLVDVHIVCSDDKGRVVNGQLDSIPVSIEDLFVKPPVPSNLLPDAKIEYLAQLYDALWEACSGPGRLGTETFSLKDSFHTVSIHGSESVKLLEAQADRVVSVVEQYLADFVVAVSGGPLATMIKYGGSFQHVKWVDDEITPLGSNSFRGPYLGSSPSNRTNNGSGLQIQVRDRRFSLKNEVKGGLGRFLILILLPPCYHLLLRMEIADESTLVRIRTDHWPCLAHVDEYLEALTMTG